MELRERVARRQGRDADDGLIVDRSALNPAVHLADPVGRGPVLERLLDVFDPVFSGDLPPETAVVGPSGSGKSALVSALFTELRNQLGAGPQTIGTTTRATNTATPSFVYVDARTTTSDFRFYHRLLDTVTEESIPERGVGTDALRERATETFGRRMRAVVAVDHLECAQDLSLSGVRDLLEPIERSVTLVFVGRDRPTRWAGQTVEVPAYRRHGLVDILTERASQGLTRGALAHESARRIARRADGDAHDALAALFGAAHAAEEAGRDHVAATDVDTGLDAVPDERVHLGRVLSLPDNRKEVLAGLLSAEVDDTEPITDVADAVAAQTSPSASTVTRFLYELAEDGVLERVRIEPRSNGGRTPSRVRPQFPPIVFRRLYSSGTATLRAD